MDIGLILAKSGPSEVWKTILQLYEEECGKHIVKSFSQEENAQLYFVCSRLVFQGAFISEP